MLFRSTVSGNRFHALNQLREDPNSEFPMGESTKLASVRMPCLEASSSLHPVNDYDDFIEDPTCLARTDDDDDDCDIDVGQGVEVRSLILGSSLSNKQKKRDAKMKFSGSRPKGRHRT